MASEPYYMFNSDRTLVRRQREATSDGMSGASAGSSIPDWVYSTGFEVNGSKTRLQKVFLDATGSVAFSCHKDTGTTPARSKTFGSSGEHELPIGADLTAFKWRLRLTAATTINAKRLMWERTVVPSASGG